MELFHCETQVGEEIPLYRGSCSAPDRPQATQVCKKVLAAWAMGATSFQYPKVTLRCMEMLGFMKINFISFIINILLIILTYSNN